MDLNERLNVAVEKFQELSQRQQAAQAQLDDITQQRLQAFGAVQVLDEMFKEQLVEQSVGASAKDALEAAADAVTEVEPPENED